MKTEQEKQQELEKKKKIIRERTDRYLDQILNNNEIVDTLESIISGNDMMKILDKFSELSGKNKEALRVICISNKYDYFKTYVSIDRNGKLNSSTKSMEILKELNLSKEEIITDAVPFKGCISMLPTNSFAMEEESRVEKKIMVYFTSITTYKKIKDEYIFMLNIYVDESIKKLPEEGISMDLNL